MTKAAELAKMGEVLTSNQLSGRRNLLYNGNFQCWQRSTSETGLGASSGYFTADRWEIGTSGSAGRFTMNRTAGDPTGFNYGLVINCTTADTSIASGEFLLLQQKLEGQDLQHLKKGSSDAETLTLSFHAKIVGSATDFVFELNDADNSRIVSKKFTLTTDWVKYTYTFPADTTGALDQDNANSLALKIWLHAGSDYTSGTLGETWASSTTANRAVGNDSLYSSTSNEFYLAGVQLEVGSVATPFEHRSFGEELALCQRYYNLVAQGNGRFIATCYYYSTGGTQGWVNFQTLMRSTPTLEIVAGTNYYSINTNTVDNTNTFIITMSATRGSALYDPTASGTIGYGGQMITNNASAYVAFTAEL